MQTVCIKYVGENIAKNMSKKNYITFDIKRLIFTVGMDRGVGKGEKRGGAM